MLLTCLIANFQDNQTFPTPGGYFNFCDFPSIWVTVVFFGAAIELILKFTNNLFSNKIGSGSPRGSRLGRTYVYLVKVGYRLMVKALTEKGSYLYRAGAGFGLRWVCELVRTGDLVLSHD